MQGFFCRSDSFDLTRLTIVGIDAEAYAARIGDREVDIPVLVERFDLIFVQRRGEHLLNVRFGCQAVDFSAALAGELHVIDDQAARSARMLPWRYFAGAQMELDGIELKYAGDGDTVELPAMSGTHWFLLITRSIAK